MVLSAPAGAAVKAGDRVAAFCALGGFAETAVAPEFFTFPLAAELDFAQGAALILNYHTAYFALLMRGPAEERRDGARARRRRRCGDRLAAGRQGPRREDDRARLDRGKKARSPSRPAPITRSCSATAGRTRCSSSPAAASTWCSTPSAAIASPTACARCARAGAWSSSASPGARSRRCASTGCCCNNTEVVGAGWGAYVMGKPDLNREIGAAINGMVDDGLHPAARRRALPARARRRGAEDARRASRDRQDRARRARRLRLS